MSTCLLAHVFQATDVLVVEAWPDLDETEDGSILRLRSLSQEQDGAEAIVIGAGEIGSLIEALTRASRLIEEQVDR
jgi:Asp/Glu/hydantoin racemase